MGAADEQHSQPGRGDREKRPHLFLNWGRYAYGVQGAAGPGMAGLVPAEMDEPDRNRYRIRGFEVGRDAAAPDRRRIPGAGV